MENSTFRSILVKELGLNQQQPLLIGFSGGPDSLFLLHFTHDCGFPLIAAHLDHGLRDNSAKDAERARKLCTDLDLECVTKRIDVNKLALQMKLSIEEAAREARYRFLFETAAAENAQAVLVAHHADDQVETILMHLLRGTGVSGLRGMQRYLLPNPWSKTIPLVRPLLSVWRSEILAYCCEHKLEPIQDETNQDTRIHRNRIRHELIPELETYHGNFRQNLLKTIEILQDEDELLKQQEKIARLTLLKRKGDQYLVFDRRSFLSLPIAMQRRLARAMIEEINSSVRDIEFHHVEMFLDFAENKNSRNYLQLFDGMELFGDGRDSLVLGKGNYDDLWPRLVQMEQIPIKVPCRIGLGNNFWLESYQGDVSEVDKSPWSAQIDADSISGQIYIRTFKAGDVFMPYGMNGKSQKLGDFWTNEGLPRKARGSWPLLCDDRGLIWVPGFRIADRCQVTSLTIEKLIIKLHQMETETQDLHPG